MIVPLIPPMQLHFCRVAVFCSLRFAIINPLDIVTFFSQIISFLSHADLTNLTDGASLRPRLSALPSVFSWMANASVTMRSS